MTHFDTTTAAPEVVDVDLDGDGYDDAVGLDVTGDGYLDIAVETVGAGTLTYLDLDGDGYLETINEDLDGDGVTDATYVDTDLDGTTDTVETSTPDTTDTTETPDTTDTDTTDTGTTDTGTTDPTQPQSSADEPYVPEDLGVAPPMGGDPGANWPPELSKPVVIDDAQLGTLPPEVQAEAAWWQQQQEGTCGPTAVAMLVSEFYGEPVDAGLFVDQARQLDLVAEDPARPQDAGMYPADIPDLLAEFGVPATHVSFSDATSAEAALTEALASGSGVIASVDADELWYGEADDARPGGMAIDHVVVVTGIDEDFVYVNDSGDPDGQARAVPKAEFFEAWDDASYEAVVTDVAPGDVDVTPYLQSAAADDASSDLDEAVQPAITFDQAIADSGRPVWLLPVVLGADALGIDLGQR